MAKATTHPTCTPTNLNIRTRSSTLYANAPILLASILLNFRRRPESHLQLQVSEKLQEFRSYRMGRRRLSGLRIVMHPLPRDEEFDSVSRRFGATSELL